MKKYLYLNILLLVIVLLYYGQLIMSEAGDYIYPLDDTYIHLSIAKHFALDGVWGITSKAFTSTTSSPLYTLLLAACIKIFGLSTSYPLMLNLLVGAVIIYMIHVYYKSQPSFTYLISLTSIIWLTPFYVQILSGMEHMLHMLFIFLLCIYSLKNFRKRSTATLLIILALGFIATLVRYESLFVVAAICLIYLLNGRIKETILLAFISLLPIAMYGVISLMNDSFFLPNSVLIKGKSNLFQQGIISTLGYVVEKFINYLHMLFLLILVLLTIYINERGQEFKLKAFLNNNFLQLVAMISILLHTLLARFGWLFRYEGYLIVISIMALAPLLNYIYTFFAVNKQKFSFDVVLILFFSFATVAALGVRFAHSFYTMNKASTNIYEQQYQMASFLNKYYNNSKIVANDIGAISYYSDIQLLDILGLGSKEIVSIKKTHKYTANTIKDFVSDYVDKNNYEIAIVYDLWHKEQLPQSFIKVAEWEISENRICGSQVVSFYSIKSKNKEKLVKSLKDFNNYIDKNVEVRLMSKFGK